MLCGSATVRRPRRFHQGLGPSVELVPNNRSTANGVFRLDKREQVFVSSTFKDLVEARELVIQGLLEADCLPAGMEMFPASDSEKWDLIKGVIDDSDYYLLIIGGRYGSVDEVDNLSYTEKEYDYAVSQNKPVLAFLHKDPGSIQARHTDGDPAKADQLEAFRTKVQEKMVKLWSDPKELPGYVAQALIKIRKSHPAVGWVRGNMAMTPETELEITQLRLKVQELTAALDKGKSHASAPIEGLAEGSDPISLDLSIQYTFKTSGDTDIARNMVRVPTTWDNLLSDMGPKLLQEATEDELEASLRAHLLQQFWASPDVHPEGLVKLTEATTFPEDLDFVILQFTALGFVKGGEQKRGVSNTNRYWMLTGDGHDRLMRLRAMRKSDVVRAGA